MIASSVAAQLVRVSLRTSRPVQGARSTRVACESKIEPVPAPDLRIRLTRVAQWQQIKVAANETKLVPAHPAKWLVEGVLALGKYSGVRHLEAVINSPVLRPDGSILDTAGYDPSTALLFDPLTSYPPLSTALTLDDAVKAAAELTAAVCDFPFAKPVHQAAWLASVLTPLARFAFEGAAPCFVADANIRGAGKGLLLDVAAIIALGRDLARAPYTVDDDEMRKSITSFALAGERMVLFDNLFGLFGGAALDVAFTSTEWQGRILGRSEQPRLPLLTTWYATGNNVVVRADTSRRICCIRIESPEERPEDREGFRHPNLLAWVRAQRGRLLAAALTMLAAYCRVGRPDMRLKNPGAPTRAGPHLSAAQLSGRVCRTPETLA